jgi:hypothetical protein
MKKVD